MSRIRQAQAGDRSIEVRRPAVRVRVVVVRAGRPQLESVEKKNHPAAHKLNFWADLGRADDCDCQPSPARGRSVAVRLDASEAKQPASQPGQPGQAGGRQEAGRRQAGGRQEAGSQVSLSLRRKGKSSRQAHTDPLPCPHARPSERQGGPDMIAIRGLPCPPLHPTRPTHDHGCPIHPSPPPGTHSTRTANMSDALHPFWLSTPTPFRHAKLDLY